MRISKKNSDVVCKAARLKFQCIKASVGSYSVSMMCRVLNVSGTGYYSWLRRPESGRSKANVRLVEIIEKVHAGSRKTYGSPRVHAALMGLGETCGKSRVARLMHKNGIRAKTKKKFRVTTDSKHKLPVADNILERDFSVGPRQKAFAGDITYLWTGEGWLYLAVVMQLATRKIVGWAMKESMDRSLVIDALKMAARRAHIDVGAIFHSDRGSQYASEDHRTVHDIFGFTQSMSRKGNCWDNGAIESFFGTLKTEHIFFENFATRDQAVSNVFEWIECFYNRTRIHSTLGYVTPEEYERQLLAA